MTSISRGSRRERKIMIPVIIIARVGVLNLLLTFEIFLGSILSRLSAIGYREAAIIPAFAVVKNASREATVIIIYPGVPIVVFAESATGVNDFLNSSADKVPVITNVIKVYKIVTIIIEVIIPRGMFFLGFLTSSETFATFKRPPNEINTKPDVIKTSLIFDLNRGLKLE